MTKTCMAIWMSSVRRWPIFSTAACKALKPGLGAVQAMTDIAGNQLVQGFLSDGQSFTLVQTLRALAMQGFIAASV